MSGLLLAFSEPGPSIPKAEYEEWYDNNHIPPRTRIPSFGAVSRWTAADSLTPTYAALYELATPEAIDDPLHTALLRNRDEQEKSVMARIALMDIRVYALQEPVHPPRDGPAFDVEKFKAGETIMSVVEVDVPEDLVEAFNKWYDEEHIPLLKLVPQWIRSRRFVLKETRVLGNDEEMKAKRGAEKVARYLAVHEYANKDALETEELKAAVATPLTQELMPKFTKVEWRLMTFQRGWSERKTY